MSALAPAERSQGWIDLNADAGEGFDSPALFAAISSANIACGGHAGDAASMRAAVELARAGRVATICLHSDAPGAAELAAAIRRALERHSYLVRPFAAPSRIGTA